MVTNHLFTVLLFTTSLSIFECKLMVVQSSLRAAKMQRIRHDDHGFFYKFFRKMTQLFDKLLSFVAEDLTRQNHIRDTPGAWRTTCCSIEQCFPTYPACNCLLKPAMLVTAACCGVPQKHQEPDLLETSVIQEIPKCSETPQTHATPKTESMLTLVALHLTVMTFQVLPDRKTDTYFVKMSAALPSSLGGGTGGRLADMLHVSLIRIAHIVNV
nr:uncharacterized protein LOC126534049 isoform X3 [Dermacentor andersoni]